MSRRHIPCRAPTLLLALLLLLGGCASNTTFHGPGLAPADLRHWQLEGKVGIKTAGDGGSAYINWQQRDDDLLIKLYGPLGQGTTYISGNRQRVSLEQPGRDTRSARSAEALMQEALGWSIPLADFRYWVKAMPSPKGRRAQLRENALGQVVSLTQHGWQLQFERFQGLDDWQLPGKIIAVRDDVQITLIIRHWARADAIRPATAPATP